LVTPEQFVQQLRSLLCFKGFDNGRRFLTINLACYLFFLVLSPLLSRAILLLFLLLLVCVPAIFASSVRRIHDAGFAKIISTLPPLIFILCVIGITYITHNASWFLLVLAALITLAIATISNARVRHNNQYIMGYSGPVDLSIAVNKAPAHHYHHERIEPTLATKSGNQLLNDSSIVADNSLNIRHSVVNQTLSWEQNLGLWFKANQKVTLIFCTTLLVLIIGSISLGLFDKEVNPVTKIAQKINPQETKMRNNKIEMPDSFWVMLDQHDALTIGWQGDYQKEGEIWSALTATGDKDCFEIAFAIKDRYRTMKVTIKNQGDYYADFSPIDTKQLIRSIANRDKFKLCGYEFSLKGTQAKLRNNKKYDSYFD
jgi:ABC-type multidrug transport system fused ATPase/permease subunit